MDDTKDLIEALRRCEAIIPEGCDGCPYENNPLACDCIRESAANTIEDLQSRLEKVSGRFTIVANNIGEIIRFRRERCGLSQRDLADLSYVDRKTISFIETGRSSKPHASTIDLLLSTLDKHEAAMAAETQAV